MGAIRRRGRNYIITYYEGSGRRRWETVAELVKKWKENYLTVQQQLGRLKPSTLRSYQSILDGHISPFFGGMPLSEVTLASVQQFIRALLGKGLSPKTIGNVIVILKEMFKHAVDASPRTRFVGCSMLRRSRCGRCC